ncbi:CPBP family intramembrane metalloprotease [Halorussus gelatinilyticus]|uniref:CPBP family intramembrane metalloprotease n=1 Tax=Halorussus gelatinilyticus TaxID=2937524 RepID=A0A8U0ILU3_9EURY|nr:type II CAAX endopeptidase family protein [Halorussus gelatinilyticus]UPW01322.1 CPBP family intramembrane metalloprotease [Halorussus gelatinilyticus]
MEDRSAASLGDDRDSSVSLGRAAKAVGWSLAVGYAGLFAIAVWGSLLVSIGSGLVPGELGTAMELALGAVALGFGTATVALLYFQWTDATLSYLDFRWPSLRDAGYVVGGVVALFALQMLVTVVFSAVGVSTASHNIEQTAKGNADILLLMIPASWLIIGPGEELLYRNIIQKDLYDTFGDWGAVLVGSAVFSLAHIPAYAAGASGLAALASTLAVIFGLSLILGATYLATENLTVPALIHGTFDAVVFGAMYLQLTGGA